MPGFLKRVCRDFENVEALESIFFAHVMSHLEYASDVWSPYYQKHSDDIEILGSEELLYALRRSVRKHSSLRLTSYESLCSWIGIDKLSRTRFNLGAMFVYDALTGRLYSPGLASKFDFEVNVPNNSLKETSFQLLTRHRSNYGLFEPVKDI